MATVTRIGQATSRLPAHGREAGQISSATTASTGSDAEVGAGKANCTVILAAESESVSISAWG